MVSKYEKIANDLRDEIAAKSKNASYKLPTEKQLCNLYQVSRQTVRQALRLLASEHMIETKQGSGTYATGLLSNPADNHVAIVVNYDSEYIFPALLHDMKSELSAQGYSTTVYTTHNKIASEREILKQLLDTSIRGLIVEGCKTALPNPNVDLYEQLELKGVSVLFLHGNYSNYSNSIWVKDDNFYGGYLLGQYLIENRHKRIAGLFKSDDIQGVERYHGWAMSMRDSSLAFPDEHTCWFSTSELNSLQQKQDTSFLTDFIHKQLKSCTAVICYNDEIAYWLIKELKYAGILVPQEVSIVCFDNSYLSDLSSVHITTLTHKPHEMGLTAAQAILKMMCGQPVSCQKISWRLLAKQSSIPNSH